MSKVITVLNTLEVQLRPHVFCRKSSSVYLSSNCFAMGSDSLNDLLRANKRAAQINKESDFACTILGIIQEACNAWEKCSNWFHYPLGKLKPWKWLKYPSNFFEKCFQIKVFSIIRLFMYYKTFRIKNWLLAAKYHNNLVHRTCAFGYNSHIAIFLVASSWRLVYYWENSDFGVRRSNTLGS